MSQSHAPLPCPIARPHARRAALLGAALLALARPAVAADPQPVAGSHGMVVSAQHIASEVGAEVLRQGGNAVDAAVAVGYALAVVYPQAGNIGGGGFMTLRLADGSAHFIDFREKAPHAARADMYLDKAGNVVEGLSTDSWAAVAVPGTVAGLEAARTRYGTRARAALMAPAIKLARDGFRLGPGDVAVLGLMTPRLAADPATAAIFAPHGSALHAGDTLRQPDLAASLQAISAQGPDAMYHGKIAARIAAASAASGGILTTADFAAYKIREFAPVECDYRGFHVISAPPPSSGGVVLCEMLNILQGYDLRSLGFHSAAEVHLLTEAMRHAYLDRNNRLGDPDFIKNPIAQMTDPGYAAGLRKQIEPEHATPSASLHAAAPEYEGHNTTQYSIVDAKGNAVSVTYTLNEWFGIGRVAAGTGILMNDEMDDFTTKPGVPNMFGLVQGVANAIAPGKTPLSSMSPTILTKDGKLAMVIGSPGGSRITTITLEAIINVIDHGMTIQEAIDAPRIHHQYLPDVVEMEPFALSPDTQKILQGWGYTLVPSRRWGIAEGIVAGGPSLGAPPPGLAKSALPLGDAGAASLFGAHDVRGGAGAAVGVN